MTLRRFLLTLCLPTAAACAGKPDATGEARTPAAPVTATAAPATADSSLIRADKARIQGSDSAKVWFIMASDFQCPFCRAFHDETWPRIEKDYVATGKIRVAFVNHPMPGHQFAMPAAEAAMCAAKQDRFWPMHDKLFQTQETWVKSANPQAIFDSLATSVGVRMDDWRSCVTTHATRGMIDADFDRTAQGGVTGTPGFFIGGQLAVVGAEPYGTFRRALDAAIAQAGGR
jgi:protein-disulfide isomerase